MPVQLIQSLFFFLCFASLQLNAQFAADVYNKYTDVGQIGLTVTNFGLIGNQFNRIDGKIQPSCLYKQHSELLREQVEHLSDAGLWVGGIVNGERRVSTAIVDGAFEAGDEGFEFMATTGIEERSSLTTDQYFAPEAVSHQDFICDFTDIGTNATNHTELGISVHLESYAWNFSFADAFVILNYTITNLSTDPIENVYAGIWADPSVANMNYTNYYEPGGGFTWYDNLDGFDVTLDELGMKRRIGYQYDADGDDGWAESYIGIKVLGSSVPRTFWNTYYQQWPWNTAENDDYPAYFMPLTDEERYTKLSTSVPTSRDPGYLVSGYPASENSWLYMISAGPLGSEPSPADSSKWVLLPGESVDVVFAVIVARWANTGNDTRSRRANLHINADWAQQAYDGEDKNRNNRLDGNEDMDGDGVIRRYILPEPPPIPNMAVEVGDGQVTLYWQNNAENFIDPVSQLKDFEGYRIYGAPKTASPGSAEFTLLGEFDLASPDNEDVGYNTGLEDVRIVNELGEPDSVVIDGVAYHYRFVNDHLKNGWLNYYAVTAFDMGDPDALLASLESSQSANRKFVYPGTVAASEWTATPSVYPNPYRGQAAWDTYSNKGRMIWFRNLPTKCELRIFTLAGDLIDVIQHDEGTYLGQDIQNINDQRSPTFAGGEHPWDLITRHDQALVTGMYLFTVEDKTPGSSTFGKVKEGKFLVLK